MSQYYQSQKTGTVIGTKSTLNVITPVTVTTAYQTEGGTKPTKTFDVGGYTRVEFNIAFNPAVLGDKFYMKVEASEDGTNFFQLSTDTTTSGTSVINVREFQYTSLTANQEFLNYGIDIAYLKIRISAKGDNVADTVYIESLLSGK